MQVVTGWLRRAVVCGVCAAALVGAGVSPAWADPDEPGDPVAVEPFVPPADDPPPPPEEPGPPPEEVPPPPPPEEAPPPPPPEEPAPASPAPASPAPASPAPASPASVGEAPPTGDVPALPVGLIQNEPNNGDVVGVAQPIVVVFAKPVTDTKAAEKAVKITTSKPVPGHFYWYTGQQLRWRPNQFWPANTAVNVNAGGTKWSFRVGDAFVATADDATHTLTVTRNGVVERTMKMSMGKTKHETKNGTYYVSEKFQKMVMDSSTYGVPATSAEGYKLDVFWATRISNNGTFIHAAPWSVGDQGKRNVSHGCINVSPNDARWYFEQSHQGDPVIVKNSAGGTYKDYDGYDDWQRFP